MIPLPDQKLIPWPGQIFRHTDGGIYRFESVARDTRDTAPLFIYAHLWPFESFWWARPAEEWASRFTQITQEELDTACRGDRAAAQAQVQAAKQARRIRQFAEGK